MAFSIVSSSISILIGIFVGFILMRMLKIGAAILGAVGSFFIGMTLYQLLFFFTESFILLMVISVAFSVLGAILSFRYFDKIVIFGTAFIGAYSLVRGASLIFGHYPNEFEMIKKLADGQPEDIPEQFFIYLIVFLAIFIGGSKYQIQKKKAEDEINFRKVD